MRENSKKILIMMMCTLIASLFTYIVPYVNAQNSSPVANANGPYEAYEGSEITFDASASYDPDEDALQYRWDFDEDGVWDTELSNDPTATYTWYDDYSGVVTVFVTDGELDDTASASVNVYNVDPVPDAGEDIEVDEGFCIPFEGLFFDTGWDDFTVVWGQDGDGACLGGVLPRLILNEVIEGSVILNTTLESNDSVVNDLHLWAERGSIISVVMEGFSIPVYHPEIFEYDFVTPMGMNETREILIEMGPETIIVRGVEKELWKLQWHITRDNNNLSFGVFSNEEGDYLTPFCKGIGDDCNQTFHLVFLQVTDDDGGYGFDTRRIVVRNVAPRVNAGDDQIVDKDQTIFFEGSFEDPGWLDTHEITWDFGDGGTAEGTLTPKHAYQDIGTYTVTLKVVDDDGDSGSDTLTVTVFSIEEIVSRVTSLEEQLVDLPGLVDEVIRLSNSITNIFGGGLVVGLVVGAVATYIVVKRKKD